MTGEDSTERCRLFVAIPVPDAVRNEMIRVQRELQPLAPAGAIRWARPDQFHLTLRFLGDVPSARVTALQEAVRAVCPGASALRLCAQGVGFFPNARSPRVIWARIKDDDRLAELQKKIQTAVHPFSTGPGGEHFAGHVTLGRFKQFKRQETGKLAACAETMKDRVFGEWTAGEIEVIRSELSPAGARHTVLAAFPLGAKD